MQVRLVYHGEFQAFTGKQVEMLHLEDSSTIASLTSRLAASHPEALPFISTLQFSRGGQTVSADAFLADGDIIDVCLPDRAIA